MEGGQKVLKDILDDLQDIAREFDLDFDSALNDFGVDEDVGCTHYNAFPCEDGAVYCPTCEKCVIPPLQ